VSVCVGNEKYDDAEDEEGGRLQNSETWKKTEKSGCNLNNHLLLRNSMMSSLSPSQRGGRKRREKKDISTLTVHGDKTRTRKRRFVLKELQHPSV